MERSNGFQVHRLRRTHDGHIARLAGALAVPRLAQRGLEQAATVRADFVEGALVSWISDLPPDLPPNGGKPWVTRADLLTALPKAFRRTGEMAQRAIVEIGG